MALVNGTSGNDVLIGTEAADTIYGLDGNDTIDGVLGADKLYGGGGDDFFKFSAVRSSFPAPAEVGLIDGGQGFDTIDWSNVRPVTLGTIQNASGQYVLGAYVGSQQFEISGVERINFGAGDDSVSPAFGSGGLELHLGAGNDTVYANAGDRIFGEEGDDSIFLSGAFGTGPRIGSADGGDGIDTLRTNIAFTVDMLAGTANSGDARYSVFGFENLEMATYSTVAIGYGDNNANTISARTSSLSGPSAGVFFDGRGGDDRISGSSVADQLFGGSGNDQLDGGQGDDQISGNDGNDLLDGGAGNDTLDGGVGIDRTSYAGLFRTYAPVTTGGVTTLSGGSAEGRDTLTGVEHIVFRDGELNSDPNSAGAQVLRIYDTVLGRAPDRSGLDFWVDQMEDRGATLSGVANAIASGPEFMTATGGLNNAAFVDYVYQHALGRGPDQGGSTFWTGQLDAGLSRGDLLVNFSESSEHRGRTANAVEQGYFQTDDTYQAIALLYDGFTNRLPDAGGLTFWSEQVKTGALTLSQVASNFAASGEFTTATNGLSNAQLVDYMFHNTLDRAPDGAGRAFWADQLDHGLTKGALLLEFSQSAEHAALMAANIIGGIAV